MSVVNRLLQFFPTETGVSPEANTTHTTSSTNESAPYSNSTTVTTPTGAELRNLLHKSCKAIAVEQISFDQKLFKDFTEFIDGLGDRLAALEQSSPESTNQSFVQISNQFNQWFNQLETIQNPVIRTTAVNVFHNFITRSFTDNPDKPGNLSLVKLILLTDQELTFRILQAFLTGNHPFEAKVFLKIAEDNELTKDDEIFQKLLDNSVCVINECGTEQIKAKVIRNLLRLSPGGDTTEKAQNLLDRAKNLEAELAGHYQPMLQELLDSELSTTAITLQADSNRNDHQKQIERIKHCSDWILEMRKFLAELYKNQTIRTVLSGDDILELLDQQSTLDGLQTDDWEMLSRIFNDGGQHSIRLFNDNLLSSTYTTAIEFAESYPAKLSEDQIRNKLEEIIEKLNSNKDCHLRQLHEYLKLHFRICNNGANDFMLGLLDNASSTFKYLIVETIAESKEFQALLREEINQNEIDKLATLFSIAKHKQGSYDPSTNLLKELSQDEFDRSLGTFLNAPITRVNQNEAGKFTDVDIVSTIAKQFVASNVEGNIVKKLSFYLLQHPRCASKILKAAEADAANPSLKKFVREILPGE